MDDWLSAIWAGIAEWVAKLTVSDWAGIVGTSVAALIGVVGLALVVMIESRDRYRARLDDTLAGVIAALARRAEELEEWTSLRATGTDALSMQMATLLRHSRKSGSGGPLDADLQAAVEVAWLAARRQGDRKCLAALGATTFQLKMAVVPWQIAHTGRIGADIRRWRSGEIGRRKFRARMERERAEAVASADSIMLKPEDEPENYEHVPRDSAMSDGGSHG